MNRGEVLAARYGEGGERGGSGGIFIPRRFCSNTCKLYILMDAWTNGYVTRGEKKKKRVDLDESWAWCFPLLIDFFSRRAPGVFVAALLPSCGVFLLADFAFWTHPSLT